MVIAYNWSATLGGPKSRTKCSTQTQRTLGPVYGSFWQRIDFARPCHIKYGVPDPVESDEQKARMAQLNLRAKKVGYRVHVPGTDKHWGWFHIVDIKIDGLDYDECVVRTCNNIDEVEAFILEKEKAANP